VLSQFKQNDILTLIIVIIVSSIIVWGISYLIIAVTAYFIDATYTMKDVARGGIIISIIYFIVTLVEIVRSK
jgi:Zn-dependent protease with chaperone function